MPTVNPVTDAEGNYLGSEIEHHVTPDDAYLYDPDDLRGVYYDSETGDLHTEQDIVEEYGEQYYDAQIASIPALSDADDATTAAYWLDTGNISEEEVDLLVQHISELEDQDEIHRAESLLLFKLGQLSFDELPVDVQEALAESGQMQVEYEEDDDEEDEYEEYEDGEDDEEEDSEVDLPDEVLDNFPALIPDLIEMAQNEGDEVVESYLEQTALFHNGDYADDEALEEALLYVFGSEEAMWAAHEHTISFIQQALEAVAAEME
jgi:hypothetical protein